AIAASLVLGDEWLPAVAAVLHRGGDILVFAAPTWVVVDAVYAPGRITFHPPAGCRCSLSGHRDDLRRLLWTFLGNEPRCVRQSSCPSRQVGGDSEHALLQPDHAEHHRLR